MCVSTWWFFLHGFLPAFRGKPADLPSYLEALEGKYLEGREVRGPTLQNGGDDWMIAIGLVVGLTLTKISSEYPQKSRVRPFVGNSRFDIRWFYINLMDAMLQLSHLFFVVCIIPWNRLKSHVLLLKVTLYCFTVGEQNAPARLIRPRFLTFVGIPGPMIWTASGMNSTLYSDVILRCFSHGCGDENNHGLTVIKPVIWLCLRISGFTQRHGWNHDGWSLWSSA